MKKAVTEQSQAPTEPGRATQALPTWAPQGATTGSTGGEGWDLYHYHLG